MTDLIVQTPAGPRRLVGAVSLSPLELGPPVIGNNSWNNGISVAMPEGSSPEILDEFQGSGEITIGVYGAHVYGRDRQQAKEFGVHGSPGLLYGVSDFGGPDQIRADNLERVVRCLRSMKQRYNLTKMGIVSQSGGTRLALAVPGYAPGLVQFVVAQLPMWRVDYFRQDSQERGDHGTVQQIDNDLGGPPGPLTQAAYDARCAYGYRNQLASCKFWIDGRLDETVLKLHHQTDLRAALEARQSAGVEIMEFRQLPGDHQPDNSWMQSATNAARAAIS